MSRTTIRRACQYVRMSTEHQRYSIDHQQIAIGRYAEVRGYEIVRTYEDAGISGLELKNRPGLKALLRDVISGEADYEAILTYDVSRWGRFQDPDRSAHYEYICREAGVPVVYCAEPFNDDGSLAGQIVKQLKRAMAAEYSRELAVKVSAAKWNLAAKGHWVGGPPGFGLRRRIVKADGTYGPILKRGEHKRLSTEHVVLVAGPSHERALVRRICRLFVYSGMSRAEISRTLNRERRKAEDGEPWSPQRVKQVLTNEKYLGVIVFGKTRGKLSGGRGSTSADKRLRTRTSYRPIVDRELFELALWHVQRRQRRMTPDDMLEGLRTLLAREGRLSGDLINADDDLPCAEVYRRRFGGLLPAYERVGFAPSSKAIKCAAVPHKGQICRRRNLAPPMSDETLLAAVTKLYRDVGRLSTSIIRNAHGIPCLETCTRRFGSLAQLYERVGYIPTAKQRGAIDQWRDRGAPSPENLDPALALGRDLARLVSRSTRGHSAAPQPRRPS